MKQLIIFGCGGHARSVADVELFNNPNRELIFVDKNAQAGESILGFPTMKYFQIKNEDVFVAIGNNMLRRNICEKYYKNLISIISKRAYLGKETSSGKGVFIAHNAHIGISSTIGDFSVINTGASIDHECSIGIAVTIAPNAVLCGKVKIGDNSWIGANATVKEKTTINTNVTVGMGAVVITNIIHTGIYTGCPAKLLIK